jgi:hypothetical protein
MFTIQNNKEMISFSVCTASIIQLYLIHLCSFLQQEKNSTGPMTQSAFPSLFPTTKSNFMVTDPIKEWLSIHTRLKHTNVMAFTVSL